MQFLPPAIALDPRAKEALKTSHPELQLPLGWDFNIGIGHRISFVPPRGVITSNPYSHPTHGSLPAPWILKLVMLPDGLRPMYYNPKTRKMSIKNPRMFEDSIQRMNSGVSSESYIAAATMKNSKNLDISKLKRTPINRTYSLRDQYFKVHDIDSGDGSLGGMNGGVFVVSLKEKPDSIFIEKRFRPTDVSLGKKEIEMLHRVMHGGLCNYIQAFVLENESIPSASLYMEFCDRGSLEELISNYSDKRRTGDRVNIPEGFIWHVLIGLADGLSYLQCGTSNSEAVGPKHGWVPILHRDIKPDNVMLRSRSTLGSGKYFYTVLSDFGLACEDWDGADPRVDKHQKLRAKLGTKTYWAPELLYNPYPRNYSGGSEEDEMRYYPRPHRHTKYSDLWAVGACVYNLCIIDHTTRGAYSHLNISGWQYLYGMTQDKWLDGTISRVRLVTSDHYTKELFKTISVAMNSDPGKRLSPVEFVPYCKDMVRRTGYENHDKNTPLPDWATKLHDYTGIAAEIRRRNGYN